MSELKLRPLKSEGWRDKLAPAREEKPRPHNSRTGHLVRRRFALADERLVAAGAAGGGGGGLLSHGDYLSGLRGQGNGEDVLSGFNLAEEILVANALETEGWFVFASGTDFTRKQQYALAIFKAGDR